jgi:branched-chain amino acid transport system substrate-binding protein
VGGDGYDDPEWIQAVGNASNNVFFTTHAFNDPSNPNPAYQKFYDAYETKFGHAPENAFAALGYDAVYLMVDAIRRAGSADPAAIRKALGETKNFQGITGTVNLDAATRIPQKGVTIIAIKDTKYTHASEVVPQQVPAP